MNPMNPLLVFALALVCLDVLGVSLVCAHGLRYLLLESTSSSVLASLKDPPAR